MFYIMAIEWYTSGGGGGGGGSSSGHSRSNISCSTNVWSPYGIGQTIYIFMLWFVLSYFFFSSPNLSRRRLDVCHTSTHGVALV